VRLRVLGCAGGELPSRRTTCFLVDDEVAIDAGALTASLDLDALLAVDDILLSHSHFDHVKDVPLLADLVVGRRTRPISVHASPECIQTLSEHVFNDRLWPDFTRIPDAEEPVIRLAPFHGPFRVGRLHFDPIPTHHTVESTGYVVSDDAGAFAISGDTGPTSAFWDRVNAAQGLAAVIVETSFPDRLQRLADLSGHLTPRTLAGELAKLRRDVPVLVYHVKPACEAEVRAELAELSRPVRILSTGDEFTF